MLDMEEALETNLYLTETSSVAPLTLGLRGQMSLEDVVYNCIFPSWRFGAC